MPNKRSAYYISLIIFCLTGIGFGFQNCAEPLDPALFTESLSSESDGNNNGTDSGEIIISQPVFSFTANPVTEGPGGAINIKANFSTNYTGELLHEYQKNGKKVSGGQNALIGNHSVGDRIIYTVTAGSVVKSVNVPLIILPAQ